MFVRPPHTHQCPVPWTRPIPPSVETVPISRLFCSPTSRPFLDPCNELRRCACVPRRQVAMNRIPSHLILVSLAILTGHPASSQSITVSEFAKLRRQIMAKDSAKIAWAAYSAGKQRVRELAPDLRRVLGTLEKRVQTDPKVKFAARSVLDALVRIDAKVPAAELAPWMNRFDVMALILAGREPEHNAGLLLQIVEGYYWDKLWQAACNLLLTAVPAMVMPKLLDQASVTLNVVVVSDDEGWIAFMASCCCGGGSMQRPAGFPPTALYSLHAGTPDRSVLLADGPQAISYLRSERAGREFGIGSCSTTVDRPDYALRCLAALAGYGPQERPLQSVMSTEVEWSTVAALRETVAQETALIRAEYRELLEELARRKLLPKARAAHLTLSLRIEVEDERDDEDKSIPLPSLSR